VEKTYLHNNLFVDGMGFLGIINFLYAAGPKKGKIK
jgi:hypothetical protein